MLSTHQFLRYIVHPTLIKLASGTGRAALASLAAHKLLMGTALVESGFIHLDQLDKADKPGPAYGLYQVEGPTHDDVLRWLSGRPDFIGVINGVAPGIMTGAHERLVYNLAYATIIARLLYWRVPEALPEDIEGLAAYWKRYYNTELGAGDPSVFVLLYRRHLAQLFA